MKRRAFVPTPTLAAMASVGYREVFGGRAAKPDRIGCTTLSFRMRFPATRREGVIATEPDLDCSMGRRCSWSGSGFATSRSGASMFRNRPWRTPNDGARPPTAPARASSTSSRTSRRSTCPVPTPIRGARASRRRGDGWTSPPPAARRRCARTSVGNRTTRSISPSHPIHFGDAEYGERIGVKILIENHGGHSEKTDNIAAIIQPVNRAWRRSLPDFYNVPAEFTTEQRVAFLAPILPFAQLVSVKGVEFDADDRCVSYDIGACVRAAEAAGFDGLYSVELWSPNYVALATARAIRSVADTIRKYLSPM